MLCFNLIIKFFIATNEQPQEHESDRNLHCIKSQQRLTDKQQSQNCTKKWNIERRPQSVNNF